MSAQYTNDQLRAKHIASMHEQRQYLDETFRMDEERRQIELALIYKYGLAAVQRLAPPPPLAYPSYPPECLDLICGAKTRKGTPCKRLDLYDNGRCRMHGGPSSGPKTTAGKQQSAKNGFRAKNDLKNP